MLARYSLELDIVWLSTCSGSLALGVSMLVLARARVFAARSITKIFILIKSNHVDGNRNVQNSELKLNYLKEKTMYTSYIITLQLLVLHDFIESCNWILILFSRKG